MSTLKPPIFVVARNGDILAFETPARVESYVESVDVEAGEYLLAYDSEGRLLSLLVETPTKRTSLLGFEVLGMRPVRLQAQEEQPSHADAMRSALSAALARISGASVEPIEAMPSEELIEEAYRRFRL
ncbi:MAG TPA: hypothetical protein VFO18_19445 [Methylomirabilota bacterium]|nr:hypothetical protein [Methylomirabilota bacterium]